MNIVNASLDVQLKKYRVPLKGSSQVALPMLMVSVVFVQGNLPLKQATQSTRGYPVRITSETRFSGASSDQNTYRKLYPT